MWDFNQPVWITHSWLKSLRWRCHRWLGGVPSAETWICCEQGHNNLAGYLEADVRRNGRNEARREVTLPWFQEEGSQPSQLGGYRIILFDHLSQDFCATKLWPKFRVDPPNSRDREPGSTRGNHFAHSFLLRFSLPSSCLNSAFRIDKKSPNPPLKHLRLPIGDRERGWISYLTIDSNPKLQFSVCLSYYFCPLRGEKQ